MYRTHEFHFRPALLTTKRRYTIDLPSEASAVIYKTMTINMHSWDGELVKSYPEYATALVQEANGDLLELQGILVSKMQLGNPCYVMEHLSIDGSMDYLISSNPLGLDVNINFVNFGIPMGKHLRIDFYTGDFKVVE